VDERSARRRPLQAALVVDRQTVKSVWHAASAGRLVARSLWQLHLPGRDPPVLATWNIHAAEKAIKHALSCLLLHVDYPERRESASIHRYDWREKSCCRKRRICERMAQVARTATGNVSSDAVSQPQGAMAPGSLLSSPILIQQPCRCRTRSRLALARKHSYS
jgi:hypothetical protein